jgi:hypothetical protein
MKLSLLLLFLFGAAAVSEAAHRRGGPAEDLTQGVPKTSLEEAMKAHEKMKTVDTGARDMLAKQNSAASSATSNIVSEERIKSTFTLLTVSGFQMSSAEAESLLGTMYSSLSDSKKLLSHGLNNDKDVNEELEKALQAGDKKRITIYKEKQELDQIAINRVITHIRDKFHLPMQDYHLSKLTSAQKARLAQLRILIQKEKSPEKKKKLRRELVELEDLDSPGLLKELDQSAQRVTEEKAKKMAESKRAAARIAESESKSRLAAASKEEKEKLASRTAAEEAQKLEQKEAEEKAANERNEEAEKAAQTAAKRASEKQRKAAADVRKAEYVRRHAKSTADIAAANAALLRAKMDLLAKQRASLEQQKRRSESSSKQEQGMKRLTAVEASLLKKKGDVDAAKASLKRAEADMKREEQFGNEKMKSLSADVSNIMKEKAELLSRKMSLESQMASNMKGAEAAVKKSHEEFRKKAASHAKSSAEKQVATMKGVMSEFMAKLATTLPKTPVAKPAPAAAAPAGVQVKGPGGNNVAVPGTTLHIECNGCGGGSSDDGESSESKDDSSSKADTDEVSKSKLETQVSTAVDAAVSKVVGVHKLRGHSLAGDDNKGALHDIEQKSAENEKLKNELSAQKDAVSKLAAKNLEKDQKIEEMTKP